MHLIRRPDYRSDVTTFITKLKKEAPHVEQGQKCGRALLWDKKINIVLKNEFSKSRIAQQPYVYQTHE